MTSVVMRRRLMAVGLAVCQMALTAPAVYAAEQDVFAEADEEAIEQAEAVAVQSEAVAVQSEAVDAAVAGGQEDAAVYEIAETVPENDGAVVVNEDYSLPYAIYSDGKNIVDIAADEQPVSGDNGEEKADTFDAANTEGSYNGGIVVEIDGSYYTQSINTILERLNDIRLEAGRNKYQNPSTGEPLGPESYDGDSFLSWSTDLEEVACYRAAEQTCIQGRKRANGLGVSSLLPVDFAGKDYKECVIFTTKGLSDGIEAIYKEKSNYYNATDGGGSNTGSYEFYKLLIDPEYTHVGVGCFKASGDGNYVVVLSMCKGKGVTLGESKYMNSGKASPAVEVSRDCISKISISRKSYTMYKGDTYLIPVKAGVKQVSNDGGKVKFKAKTGRVVKGITWEVAPSIKAVVDEKGVVTANNTGYCLITGYLDQNTYTSLKLNINGIIEPVKTTEKSTARIATPSAVDGDFPVTTEVTYNNAATYTGKAIKVSALGVSAQTIDISDLSDAFGTDLKSAVTYKYKYSKNKKVFVDEYTDENQPYFYVQISLNSKKAKKAGVTGDDLKKLKTAVKEVNKKLKDTRCYFYINPKPKKK